MGRYDFPVTITSDRAQLDEREDIDWETVDDVFERMKADMERRGYRWVVTESVNGKCAIGHWVKA